MVGTPKAVISQLLAEHLTPLLKPPGFTRHGRTYYRPRDGRDELVNVQASSHNNRNGGSFTVNLAVFFPDLDRIVSPYPVHGRAEEFNCPIWYRIGRIDPDGRVGDVARKDLWWEFDNQTDLAALGAEVAGYLQRALMFFERLGTRAAIRHALRGEEIGVGDFWKVALAAWAGDRELAQRLLDGATGRHEQRRAATIAPRLGLAFEAPAGEQEVVVTFQLREGTAGDRQESLFYSVSNDLDRTLRPTERNYLFHVAIDHGVAWHAYLYGPDPEDLLAAIRPVIDRYAPDFADVTWTRTA
jgi:hypothetical protein